MGATFDSRRKPQTAQFGHAPLFVEAQNDAGKAQGASIHCVSDAQREKGISVQFIVDQLDAISEQQRRTMTFKDARRSILVGDCPRRRAGDELRA